MASATTIASPALARPKPKFQYKMFIAPALLLAGNYFKVDYNNPDIIFAVRVAYVLSQGLVLLSLLYIAHKIYDKVPQEKQKTLVPLRPTAKYVLPWKR